MNSSDESPRKMGSPDAYSRTTALGSTQIGVRTFPFEHGDLLPQGEDFQGDVPPTPEEDADCGQESEDEIEHEATVVT